MSNEMGSALEAHVTVEKRYVLACSRCWHEITNDEGDAEDVALEALRAGWTVQEHRVCCPDCGPQRDEEEED